MSGLVVLRFMLAEIARNVTDMVEKVHHEIPLCGFFVGRVEEPETSSMSIFDEPTDREG